MPYKYERPPSIFVVILKSDDTIVGSYLTREAAEKRLVGYGEAYEIFEYYSTQTARMNHPGWIPTTIPITPTKGTNPTNPWSPNVYPYPGTPLGPVIC